VPLIQDQAICIRHWDWSETSQTVSLFSREHGIIRGVAKGSKREKSDFSGGIELMTRGEVVASLKNSDALSTLTAWDLQETFAGTRRTLAGFYAGMALLDILQHAMQPADPHPALFDAAVSILRELSGGSEHRGAITRLLWATLSETGYRPDVNTDILSGVPLKVGAASEGEAGVSGVGPPRVFNFYPGLGGFSGGIGDNTRGEFWRVRAGTLAALRAMETPSDDVTLLRTLQLLTAYYRHVFATEANALGKYVEFAAGGQEST